MYENHFVGFVLLVFSFRLHDARIKNMNIVFNVYALTRAATAQECVCTTIIVTFAAFGRLTCVCDRQMQSEGHVDEPPRAGRPAVIERTSAANCKTRRIPRSVCLEKTKGENKKKCTKTLETFGRSKFSGSSPRARAHQTFRYVFTLPGSRGTRAP